MVSRVKFWLLYDVLTAFGLVCATVLSRTVLARYQWSEEYFWVTASAWRYGTYHMDFWSWQVFFLRSTC
jgi:hypothetical protein